MSEALTQYHASATNDDKFITLELSSSASPRRLKMIELNILDA
ncbi:hypothetical protein [Vibrio albus]|nr:hypothetical protein [Vibrio albus]